MYDKVPIMNRIKLHGYLWDMSWAESSIKIVGLMLQNTPEEYQEELAESIQSAIQGLSESQALKMLNKLP